MFYSIESEKTVLGSILFHGTAAMSRIAFLVKPQDFFMSEHGTIFDIALKLAIKKLEISWLSIFNEIKEASIQTISEEFLKELVLSYRVDIDSAVTFASQISEMAGKRVLKEELEKTLLKVTDETLDFPSAKDSLGGILNKVSTYGVKTFAAGTEIANQFLANIGPRPDSLVFFGKESIDSKVKNLVAGEITVLAARPAVGKTALAIHSAVANFKKGKKILFITMEMDPDKILLRAIAMYTGIEIWKIEGMSSEEFTRNRKLSEALILFTSGGFFIETCAPYDLNTVLSTISSYKYKQEIDIVYLDYIQLISMKNGERSSNRNNEITDISRLLKNQAGTLRIPYILLSQLNRAVTQRPDGKPELSDLRDSGAIEQDASTVWFLYEKTSSFNVDQESKNPEAEIVELNMDCAKQRGGKVFNTRITFNKPKMQFTLSEAAQKARGLDF